MAEVQTNAESRTDVRLAFLSNNNFAPARKYRVTLPGMPAFFRLGLLALGSALPAAAQAACSAHGLSSAAGTAASIRHQLHTSAVANDDPAISSAVAAQLEQLKGALALAAQAAFACASAGSSPETLQTQIAGALHANLLTPAVGPIELKGSRSLGVYGTDLSVQVFELFGKPRLFEVDFRYGIQCGDDHLLLVFQAASDTAPDGWHQQLRWDAPGYKSVGDAFGDFVLLTPITGDPQHPSWRYLVAHGHPGCDASPRRSQFDLDLLTPTADPGKPAVSWHLRHDYTQDGSVARLVTTESTIEFRLVPANPNDGAGKDADTNASPAAASTQGAEASQIYRFHLKGDGTVEPAPANAAVEGTAPATSTGTQASTTH